MARNGHVSLWHPWMDKPGQSHELCLFDDFGFSSVEETIATLTRGKYYAITGNILRSIPTDLIRHQRSEPYLSRNGNTAAIKIRGKRGNSFLIPAKQWSCSDNATNEVIDDMRFIFTIFNREALTPPSLSEKVLRSTLPDKLYISRPSIPLRKTLLDNRAIPRILKQKRGIKSKEAYEYDMIKAYLSIAASGVPSPFSAPIRFYHSDIWQDYPVSFMRVQGTAHVQNKRTIQPLRIKTGYDTRDAMDNETFDTWMWSGKYQDCLQAGYTMEVLEGYTWMSMSRFMETWADILYRNCEKYREERFYPILKQMTQGLPGRFLKAPEVYTLVHLDEIKSGAFNARDCLPIQTSWTGNESPMSDWFMAVDTESEKAVESAQLTPIGDYIVAECERKMYKAALEEEQAGNRVLRIYVDSLTTTLPAKTLTVGTKVGQFKIKRYFKAVFKENRFYGYEEETGKFVAKTPGMEEDSVLKKRTVKREYTWRKQSCNSS